MSEPKHSHGHSAGVPQAASLDSQGARNPVGHHGNHHSSDHYPGRRYEDNRTYMQRWLPHPLLTFVLVLLWMALLNSFTIGGLVVGLALGMMIPIYTANFWPQRPVIRRPLQVVSFVFILIFDVIVANIQVAYRIVFRRPEQLNTRWITVPLDLTSPEAITALTATITLTPGTVASDLSADGRSLLVHCLDVGSEKEMVRTIKDRYESRIKAIFP
jgi:multicomponent K+:H+ antiporter subunit E